MDQITDELLQKTIGEMSGMEFIQLFKVAIKKAITQIGRKIVVDKKMALELAGQPTFHRRGA